MNHENDNLPNHSTYIIDYLSAIPTTFVTVSSNMKACRMAAPLFFRKRNFEMFLQQMRKFPDQFAGLFSACQVIEFLRIVGFII